MNYETKIWLGVVAFLFTSVNSPMEANANLLTNLISDSKEVIHTKGLNPLNHFLIGQGGEGGETKPPFQDKLSGTQLLNTLQKGGYVIFLRHVKTEVDYADQVFARMGYCTTQRVLGEEG
ncbi:hypothetical protein [Leptothermofonsia sp. ETS-13]|uniref:hypothetical protein n=1 Tax=Leptothermofonsia sp. ETS-13 TaxID=3035696 RepID=UPI003BA11B42